MSQPQTPLKLTSEIIEILGDKVTDLKVNFPLSAIDTFTVGEKEIALSAGFDGIYSATVKNNITGKSRTIAVTTSDIASSTPILGPLKFLDTFGIEIPGEASIADAA